MSVQLYGFWRSIASFRVRVALRLKGVAFEEIPIDILSGEQFKPGYEAVNAERVVPTLIHDGYSVFQSLAIVEYLDDIEPSPRLLPQDARERAYARSLGLMTIAADICIAGQVVGAHFLKLELTAFPTVSRLAVRCFEMPAFATSHPFAQPGFKTP